MSVLYYYYFLFYQKILKDDQPHLLTILALSASEGFLLNGIIDIIALKFFCLDVNKWIMLGLLICILGINIFIFYKKGKGAEIVKQKPRIFGNNYLSMAISIIFFIITISWLFWGPVCSKFLLENCGK